MKKLLLALMMVAGISVAQAQVSGNLGLTSDYRFRGISQTQNAPAVQGGIDYAHKSGFYIGNWNSSVSSSVYTNGAGVESDVYAGYKKEIMGITVDVGSYNYFYPRATTAGTGSNFDTYEGYVGLGYGPVTVKYSQTLGNGYFGTANAKGTGYYEANVAYPIPSSKISLLAHAGHTNVANSSSLDYSDYNFGVGYDLQGWALAAKYYTNGDKSSAFNTANTVNGQKLYRNAAVVSVSKAF
jgi:uncharacterized protein (TIGR02001 family)